MTLTVSALADIQYLFIFIIQLCSSRYYKFQCLTEQIKQRGQILFSFTVIVHSRYQYSTLAQIVKTGVKVHISMYKDKTMYRKCKKGVKMNEALLCQ